MISSRVPIILRLDPEFRDAIRERTETNATDLVAGILADEFAVAYEPNGRPGGLGENYGKTIFQIPPELKRRIALRAVNEGSNMTAVVSLILARHWGLPYVPSTRSVPVGGGRRR